MPAPSNSTAAVLKNLNPLSLSFLVKSSIALLAMLKFAKAASFSANNVKYILSPFNGTQSNWDQHNSEVYRKFYSELFSGKCNVICCRSNDGISIGEKIVSITSITVWKENFLPFTATDLCIKDMAYNVSNSVLNTVQATISQNITQANSSTTPVAYFNSSIPNATYIGSGLNTTAVIYGTIFPVMVLGIILALGIALYPRIKARLVGSAVEERGNIPAAPQEIQLIAGQIGAAQPQPAAAAINVPEVARVEVSSMDVTSPTP